MITEKSNTIRQLKIERFGEKLRLLRERHHLTHLDIAYVLGYTGTSQVDHLEKGCRKPTAEVVLKIAKLFDVSADVLLDDKHGVEGDELD